MTHNRTKLSFLLLALAFGFLACAIDQTSMSTQVEPQEWDKARGPVVPHDTFPMDCALCHEGDNWQTIRADFVFDHAKETGYPLVGAHEAAECLRCHNDRGPVELYSQRGCAGCHEDVHESRMGSECSSCHSQSNWLVKDAIADHARTRFPLMGAHAAAACFACHEGAEVGVFDRASIACVDCHADALATAPAFHADFDNETQCQTCHAPVGWGLSGFKHDAFFPLTGQHRTASCEQCHPGQVYDNTPNTCVGCHESEYLQAVDPNHTAAGFGTNCQQCHSSSGWEPSSYGHPGWPLTGAHRTANCNACHSSVYDGTPNTCISCHSNEYNTAPNHVEGNFSQNCLQCHSTSTWQGVQFSHAGITSGCTQCHLDDFNASLNSSHQNAGTNPQCQQCHNTNSWDSAGFSHAGITNNCASCHLTDFSPSANSAHSQVASNPRCEQCHTPTSWSNGNFSHAGITNGCVNCHLPDYQSALNPNHVANNFSQQCQTCHTSTTTWQGANFSHTGITSGCSNCHMPDYNSTTSPNHAAVPVSTTCNRCHGTTNWNVNNMNHTGITQNCHLCHANDFNPNENNSHRQAGASTHCQNCHSPGGGWD